jgi:hypothetical protein
MREGEAVSLEFFHTIYKNINLLIVEAQSSSDQS